ncbi:bifunctional ADP-heptose synthase (sugar kinase/adenylyltransferase) [Methanococcus voltae PS]|uniref:D-glycero-D-manno-heptose-7-phosphate 1-kinase n=2 Tax=Methanococcus voltae TaxID=2188 RepID=Q2EMU3_METVO|nr:PfkB family carbohydrate kinase [Methanococcus voltae]ABD17741.1 D-glycero-D-manno-heptose-7-phosphate 1-kinase [Methanococcus voltae PS]MCS3922221.1 bifunctional ADP-heptose synthase (sugar kinase/adenylyltransferase) [Methanococcus voltae PS]
MDSTTSNFNILEILKKFNDLNVLLIGETILDQYYFVTPKGRASKDPMLSTQYEYDEMYLGGILAPAKHLSNFVNSVDVVTLIGETNSHEEFIRNNVLENENGNKINLNLFVKENSPTIVKRRYLEPVRNSKLFKVEFINDEPISKDLEAKIIDKLDEIIKHKNIDVILVNDFGHGMITENIIQYLEGCKKYLAINVQTNSGNYGFNPITKFSKADFLSLNTLELRIIYQNRLKSYEELLDDLIKNHNFDNVLLTLGKEGCLYCDGTNYYQDSAITKNTVDTIGAGDATFCLTAIANYLNEDSKNIPKFANVIGAIAVGIMGNKESITKDMILNCMHHKE